ncbi:Glycerol-3-phosphate dehydrogenase [NAD(P)+] [Thalassovita gelatinovora]|uniref:Glycerol-3-phosphate dehydrogenase [NAD(P)+] n=1 Tax=Thalassovita gelatinovora TaxID=53501 RepID=A0A0P1FT39_THAGE|nr:NAD(P)H-dependent glycerol-3-phosphate dehydrogenase [Thalassovita gelatinovora]QIZ81021.1 NAD(P)-dependent glycerol-3-phosphate dehydrogenase [Thalassovita gelatinovora]CUH65048.1 Glycerol-3-phosphate dehydrogenase [NAD(P)+] [Thalassovita gelatinovora]SEP87420.1 glycerol-3-phosphate dehydrogenase (NAD(P)+) [Thalassovita gelatinovora]
MIAVAGSGAFGTALAISLAATGQPVQLWARDPNHAAEMEQTRENARRLPGVEFPDTLRVITELESVAAEIPILLATPMQRLRDMLVLHKLALGGRPLVACCKGVELSTGLGPVGVIEEVIPSALPAILTGPSFAIDIARGLPTALTLACRDRPTSRRLQQSLSTHNLRIYRTVDTTGAELGGAVKNVIAIASGAVMGAKLGESARAALMTRGYAEMQRMALALGARPETLAGLSGFGDLALTCTSEQSRNYRFGLALGRRETFDPTITVEGAATARAVLDRARVMLIDMPITEAVVALLDGRLQLSQAMEMLLSRPLKEE